MIDKSIYEFVDLLKTEVSLYDGTMYEPQDKYIEGTRQIGIVPENLRKMFAYMTYCFIEKDKLESELRHDRNNFDKKQLCGIFAFKGELLRLLLWINIDSIFNCWAENLSIIEDWKIVEAPQPPDIFRMFRM
jgi:hypothetical protein